MVRGAEMNFCHRKYNLIDLQDQKKNFPYRIGPGTHCIILNWRVDFYGQQNVSFEMILARYTTFTDQTLHISGSQ